MKKISWNWRKGSMQGGLRMSLANLERIRDDREVNLEARKHAAAAVREMWAVGEILAKQRTPL